MSIGPDNVFDLGSTGPLVIRVLSVDAALRVVHLSLARRAARPGPESRGIGPSHGGLGGDGGSLVWTSGRGLQRIPPYSPLRDAVVLLSDLAALHELARNVPQEQAELVRARSVDAVRSLKKTVDRVAADAPPSPMDQSLSGLAALEEARRRFEADTDRGDVGQEYLEIGRRTVEQLTAVIEAAIRDERQL